jgi:hypothetical protein
MTVNLVDGTYELFRYFYGLRRFNKGVDRPYGAVVGVLQSVLQMIESGDRVKGSASRDLMLGVATDHVIESVRNRLWGGLQDRRRHRARVARAVPSARRGACGNGLKVRG